MSVYRASPDLFVIALSTFVTLVLAGLALYALRGAVMLPSLGPRLGMLLAGLLCIAVLVFAWGYSPRGYRLADNILVVERPFGDEGLPFDEIRNVELSSKWFGISFKTGGNSGLFGIYGNFYNKELGNFRMLASRASGAVVLRTDANPIVITPDEPERFIEDLRGRIRAEGS